VVHHNVIIVKATDIHIIIVTMNLNASNATNTIKPRIAQKTEVLQPNARSILRHTQPTSKDAEFIDPSSKNVKKLNPYYLTTTSLIPITKPPSPSLIFLTIKFHSMLLQPLVPNPTSSYIILIWNPF
jgi:hypothetical protein